MIRIEFTEKEINRLYELSIKDSSHIIRLKALAVYLKSLGFKHNEICTICNIQRSTLSKYLTRYKSFGIESFKPNYKGSKSVLNNYEKELKEYFQTHFPKTLKEAKAMIKEQTGIERSIPQVRLFLIKIGIRRLKTGVVPGNGKNIEQNHKERIKAQEEFLEEKLEPLLDKAKKKNI